jgi:hypothetical protein
LRLKKRRHPRAAALSGLLSDDQSSPIMQINFHDLRIYPDDAGSISRH